ncbi:MAG: proton-conducting transporter membrane subunit [Bacteroidales bacterium]
MDVSWATTIVAVVLMCFLPITKKWILAIATVIINATLTSIPAVQALGGTTTDFSFYAGTFLGDVPILIDGLSAWFILIINFTSITGVIYGAGYLKAYKNAAYKLSQHWILFILFHLSMIWVTLLQNGFVFLIAWEIMSLSSMLLVIFDGHLPKTLKAGVNYFVQMHISIVFLTIGFLWVYLETGSFGFDAFQTFFASNNNLWLFIIFFVGFGLKAGFIPLHSWLPHAHPAAPSHISGVMSGVIVKLGIYGLIRVILYVQSDFNLMGEMIISISILTGLYGILNAAVHRDFKKMLAYCTIENIGIIGIGIGLGMIGLGSHSPILYYLGFGGALLHVLNHSLFKSLLFFAAGSVYQQTHTRDMERLGGLIKSMPQTAIIFLIGAIAIAGIPPFNGFVSEFVIYSGLIEGLKSDNINLISLLILSFAGLSLMGGLSILTFTKSFGTLFLGNERETLPHQPHEVTRIMLLPQYLIIAVMLSVAFVPQWYLAIVGNLLSGMALVSHPIVQGFDVSTLAGYSTTLSQISLYSLLFIAVIGLFWMIRQFAQKSKSIVMGNTWGCAYIAPNNRMQYTGKSYSKPLVKRFSFMLIEKKRYPEIIAGEIFPQTRKYSSHYLDFIEHYIIDNAIRLLLTIVNYFKFIQNGRVQSYVMYGIVFILTIFVLTLLNLLK